MSVLSKRSHDGWLMLDHRASPGIPEDKALRMGLNPREVREGGVLETATIGCPHCGGCVVLNPWRTRERAHCHKCDKYICDGCAAAASDPDYVHRTFQELADMVRSGRWTVSGGTASRPNLIRVGDNSDG